ncbi:nucleotide pyrophosphohydrolase [Singulisphaera sp. PoT]|uniref:nucleotide pyrophosphohydrolase n=1 Tax=Singulisphaera sp. PoT TaxID=3411797 RepID=UPI003BF5D847
MDRETTVEEMKEWLRIFSRERDWEQFHHPKDLGVALACEVGELLEHFRYRKDEEIREKLEDPQVHREVSHELADCLWLILRLGDVCGVDLSSALHEKLALAALKYPIDKSYGRADKYTTYQVKKND